MQRLYGRLYFYSHAVISYHLSFRAASANVLTETVASDLVPLNLLSRHWKLSAETFERALAQTNKALVELLLVLLFCDGNLLADAGTSA